MVSMDAEGTQSKDTTKQEDATEGIKRPKKMRLDKPPEKTRGMTQRTAHKNGKD
jgi:hypothetical protein